MSAISPFESVALVLVPPPLWALAVVALHWVVRLGVRLELPTPTASSVVARRRPPQDHEPRAEDGANSSRAGFQVGDGCFRSWPLLLATGRGQE